MIWASGFKQEPFFVLAVAALGFGCCHVRQEQPQEPRSGISLAQVPPKVFWPRANACERSQARSAVSTALSNRFDDANHRKAHESNGYYRMCTSVHAVHGSKDAADTNHAPKILANHVTVSFRFGVCLSILTGIVPMLDI
jgi:hypothetical protein